MNKAHPYEHLSKSLAAAATKAATTAAYNYLTQPSMPKKKPGAKKAVAPKGNGRLAPVAYGNVTSAKNSTQVHITRTELFDDVYGSQENSLRFAVRITPYMFPWTFGVAYHFNMYELEAVVFRYIPSTTTATTGSVHMAIDYDPAYVETAYIPEYMSQLPTSKIGDAWTPFEIRYDFSRNRKQDRYVRPQDQTGLDPATLRQNYCGTFYLGVSGQANANQIGRVWVDYRFKLKVPRAIQAGSQLPGPNGFYATFAGSSNALPFGSSFVSGYVPLSFASTGTTTSVTTFTALEPFDGYLYLNITGADLTPTPSGSGEEAAIDVFDDNTRVTGLYSLQVKRGETFILTLANTSVTALSARVIRGFVA
jgi:hypothetical protein